MRRSTVLNLPLQLVFPADSLGCIQEHASVVHSKASFVAKLSLDQVFNSRRCCM